MHNYGTMIERFALFLHIMQNCSWKILFNLSTRLQGQSELYNTKTPIILPPFLSFLHTEALPQQQLYGLSEFENVTFKYCVPIRPIDLIFQTSDPSTKMHHSSKFHQN